MKTIGLIGGLSWESTSEYYRYINEMVKRQKGGLHSAKIVMYSFNFEEMVELQHSGKWDIATKRMIEAGKTLQNGGVDIIVICTNTMHICADEMRENLDIPLLHIVDTVAEKIEEQKITKVGLLGTKFTMEQPFYKELLKKQGIEVVVPNEDDRQVVHDVIYEELCKGKVKESSKEKYLTIIEKLQQEGAGGIILGCTEIPLLIQQKDTSVPLFDTTYIHAVAAVEFALKEEKLQKV
ncbi:MULTISPECIES: aspartate/glutamate racemase family protein [Bacillus]|uniref:aspartate/glutamate racemase family protein n=1 Tax=Bacillus TaxID=1386 RepID=UPI000BB67D88|nr:MULTISPECIES: aspartate/glutamate racemase family protein [Bacillus]